MEPTLRLRNQHRLAHVVSLSNIEVQDLDMRWHYQLVVEFYTLTVRGHVGLTPI